MTRDRRRYATYAGWTIVVLATPFVSYELVRAVTGDAEAASRAMRRTWGGITNAAQMWVVLELFLFVKIARIRSAMKSRDGL